MNKMPTKPVRILPKPTHLFVKNPNPELSVIKSIAKVYNSQGKHEAGRMVQYSIVKAFKDCKISPETMRTLYEFKITDKTYSNIKETFQKRRLDQNRLNIYIRIKLFIKEYLMDNSKEAANQTAILNKESVPVRSLMDSKRNLYSKLIKTEFFKKIQPQNPGIGTKKKRSVLSQSYFYNIIREFKIFKNAIKKTDLCSICELGKVTIAKRDLLLKKDPASNVSKFNNVLLGYENHCKIFKHQDMMFKESISYESLLKNKGKVIILMDFKENIKLNEGGRTVGHDYYETSQRTYFGFICYYIDEKGVLTKMHIDIISILLDHSTTFVISAFEKLFSLPQFKEMNGTNFEIWSDTGPHFRSYQFMHYLLKHRPETIQVNFFAEKHGKSPCDSHFSLISRYKTGIEVHKRISSSSQFIELMEAQIKLTASLPKPVSKEGAKDPKKFYYFEVMDEFISPFDSVFSLAFKDITTYYSFMINSSNQLMIGILTGQSMKSTRYYIKEVEKVEKIIKLAPEIPEAKINYGIYQEKKFKRQIKIL
jgi:hypothetical protein